MVVELICQETLDVIQKSEAKPYIKNALDIINFMVMNNLEDINSCDRYFMALTFDERISHPEMYGHNNYCRALSHCNGRLPSNGDMLCYLSRYRNYIEIVFVDKEKDVYFSLDLFPSVINAIRYGITLDTEKFE